SRDCRGLLSGCRCLLCGDGNDESKRDAESRASRENPKLCCHGVFLPVVVLWGLPNSSGGRDSKVGGHTHEIGDEVPCRGSTCTHEAPDGGTRTSLPNEHV